MSVYEACIPGELKRLRQWLLWRWESVRGGPTKVPYTPAGRRASSTDPNTWGTFEEVLSAFGHGSFAGVGCVVTAEDPYCGLDLDKCLNPGTGEVSGRAVELVRRFDSYTERTPSGEGLRIWVRACKNGGRCSKPGLEIYDSGRYFTVTGQVLSGCRETIEERQAELDALIAEEFPGPEPETNQKRPYVGSPGEGIDLEEFLAAADVPVLREVADGSALRVFGVVCPWVREHTAGDPSGTRLGQYPGGALFFHCEHAHCSQRRWPEFRNEVDPRVRVKLRRCKARRVWNGRPA